MQFIFSIFFLLSFQKARADEFTDFKNSALEVVDSLRGQGNSQIGDLNLDSLAQEISTTNWSLEEKRAFLGSGEDRTLGIYLVSEKTVIVNTRSLKLLPRNVYAQASLHEALGAQGYYDENSEISLPLDIVSRFPHLNQYFVGRFKNMKLRRVKNEIYASGKGGGTSVGGGGDGPSIEFRTRLLEHLLSVPETISQNNVDAILDVKIKPDWTPSAKNSLEIARPTGGDLIITLPSFNWAVFGSVPDFGEGYKHSLVTQALGYLVGVKP